MNFTWWDMSTLVWNFFQSEIVNERNFLLTSWYANYFNKNWWNNNFYCYDKNGNYEDDDCLFRGFYGFLPPQKKIDVWLFSRQSWTKMIFSFTWAEFSWVDLVLNEVSWKKRYFYKITQKTFEFPKTLTWSVYNAKLTNLWTWWIQYFMNFTWWEWIKDFNVAANGQWIISSKYNYVFWKTKLFSNSVDYKLWITLNIDDSEVLTYLWLNTIWDQNINQIHYNTSWINMDWFFIQTNMLTLTQPEKIYVVSGIDDKFCYNLLQWYYRTPSRWTTVYPLDSYSLAQFHAQNLYTWLDMKWWFYSFCSGDNQSIYWQIEYIYTGGALTWTVFKIQAWGSYDFTWNSIVVNNNMYPSLQLTNYNWYYILNWIIFDSAYGIWYIWWILDKKETLSKILDLTNTKVPMNNLVKTINDKTIFFIDSISGSATRYYKKLKY